MRGLLDEGIKKYSETGYGGIRRRAYRALHHSDIFDDEVRGYFFGLLAKDVAAARAPKQEKRGRRANVLRDRVLAIAVERIAKRYGLDRTRSAKMRKQGVESACSIVATVLKRMQNRH